MVKKPQRLRLVDGQGRRWSRNEGFLRVLYVNKSRYGGRGAFMVKRAAFYSFHNWPEIYRRPHPAFSYGKNLPGYSRRQGNPKVWAKPWIKSQARYKRKPRQPAI